MSVTYCASESHDPFSKGRGSKKVIFQALHCKFLLGLLGLCSLFPASSAVQTDISCGQCVFNISLGVTISWDHPQYFCSLPYSLENDSQYVSKHASHQSQLFYFLFGALFILFYLKWLHLEYNMEGEPSADGMVNGSDVISPSEATSPPQDSDLNYLVLMMLVPMPCYWVYKNSKYSTSDSGGAMAVEELSIFTPSYHPP